MRWFKLPRQLSILQSIIRCIYYLVESTQTTCYLSFRHGIPVVVCSPMTLPSSTKCPSKTDCPRKRGIHAVHIVNLTHWGRLTHICVIGSDNGLSPGRRKAIVRAIAGILLIGPLVTHFSEILMEIHIFSSTKMHLKMPSGKWQPFCLGLNVLKYDSWCMMFEI